MKDEVMVYVYGQVMVDGSGHVSVFTGFFDKYLCVLLLDLAEGIRLHESYVSLWILSVSL